MRMMIEATAGKEVYHPKRQKQIHEKTRHYVASYLRTIGRSTGLFFLAAAALGSVFNFSAIDRRHSSPILVRQCCKSQQSKFNSSPMYSGCLVRKLGDELLLSTTGYPTNLKSHVELFFGHFFGYLGVLVSLLTHHLRCFASNLETRVTRY